MTNSGSMKLNIATAFLLAAHVRGDWWSNWKSFQATCRSQGEVANQNTWQCECKGTVDCFGICNGGAQRDSATSVCYDAQGYNRQGYNRQGYNRQEWAAKQAVLTKVRQARQALADVRTFTRLDISQDEQQLIEAIDQARDVGLSDADVGEAVEVLAQVQSAAARQGLTDALESQIEEQLTAAIAKARSVGLSEADVAAAQQVLAHVRQSKIEARQGLAAAVASQNEQQLKDAIGRARSVGIPEQDVDVAAAELALATIRQKKAQLEQVFVSALSREHPDVPTIQAALDAWIVMGGEPTQDQTSLFEGIQHAAKQNAEQLRAYELLRLQNAFDRELNNIVPVASTIQAALSAWIEVGGEPTQEQKSKFERIQQAEKKLKIDQDVARQGLADAVTHQDEQQLTDAIAAAGRVGLSVEDSRAAQAALDTILAQKMLQGNGGEATFAQGDDNLNRQLLRDGNDNANLGEGNSDDDDDDFPVWLIVVLSILGVAVVAFVAWLIVCCANKNKNASRGETEMATRDGDAIESNASNASSAPARRSSQKTNRVYNTTV